MHKGLSGPFLRVLLAKSNLLCYTVHEMTNSEVKEMARNATRTANIYTRVDPDTKEQAEQILTELGIPMSNAIGMFLKQVVIQRGIPFEMKLPAAPVAVGALTKEQFDAELQRGMEDARAGRVVSADTVEAELFGRYNA